MATQITLQAGQTLNVGDGNHDIDDSAGNNTVGGRQKFDVAGDGNDHVIDGLGDTITLVDGNVSVSAQSRARGQAHPFDENWPRCVGVRARSRGHHRTPFARGCRSAQ